MAGYFNFIGNKLRVSWLENWLPFLLNGVRGSRLSPQEFVALTSTNGQPSWLLPDQTNLLPVPVTQISLSNKVPKKITNADLHYDVEHIVYEGCKIDN